jgi:plastocyanin
MRRLAICLTLATLAVAGCGGDDEETAESTPTPTPTATATAETGGAPSGGGETLTIAADPGGGLKFDKEELQAKAGKVTISMDNPSDLPHAVAIDGGQGATPGKTVNKGGKSVASAELDAGEYTYFCPVGDHRSGGMEGTLTVQ